MVDQKLQDGVRRAHTSEDTCVFRGYVHVGRRNSFDWHCRAAGGLRKTGNLSWNPVPSTHTCSERKICSTPKLSQPILGMPTMDGPSSSVADLPSTALAARVQSHRHFEY